MFARFFAFLAILSFTVLFTTGQQVLQNPQSKYFISLYANVFKAIKL